jgi:hypothetical protein
MCTRIINHSLACGHQVRVGVDWCPGAKYLFRTCSALSFRVKNEPGYCPSCLAANSTDGTSLEKVGPRKTFSEPQ